MKNDRFLLGILIFIGLLVVTAVALFFARGAQQEYLPADTPEGVVHNYALALSQGDYEQAYGYLAEGKGKPTLTQFTSVFSGADMIGNVGIRIASTDVIEASGDTPETAIVRLTVIHGSSGPFDSGYTSDEPATLQLQNGGWKIQYMPWPYWSFDWYEGKVP